MLALGREQDILDTARPPGERRIQPCQLPLPVCYPPQMSFRFRQSVTLFPGVRLNFSKTGVSVSAGVPGATVNLGRQGAALTLGLPGTGISYRTQLTGGASAPASPADQPPAGSAPLAPTAVTTPPATPLPGEIRSADIAQLTSRDLAGLKRMILAAEMQRAVLQAEWGRAIEARSATWREIRTAQRLPQRLWKARHLPELRGELETVEGEAKRISEAYAASFISLDFALDEATIAAFLRLDAAHAELARSAAIWDVTSSIAADSLRDRTIAGTSITRVRVTLGRSQSSLIAARWSALRLGNANGESVEIFPGLCLMRRTSGSDFALLDLREVQLTCRPVRFHEDEAVPSDAQVVGHTWLKANADGSPDRRFRENRQIPVALYGRLEFRSTTGLAEDYMFSDPARATTFAEAFNSLQNALRQQDEAAEQDTVPVSVPGAGAGRTLTLPELSSDPLPPTRVWPLAVGAAGLTAVAWFTLVPSRDVPRVPEGTPSPFASSPAAAPAATVASQPVAPAAPSQSAAAPLPIERVVTRQNANLRAEPNGSAEVLRTVPASTALRVFGRNGNWVRVGDREAAGWIHNSLLAAGE